MIDYELLLIVEQDDLDFLHYYEMMMHDNANYLTKNKIFFFFIYINKKIKLFHFENN